MTGFQFGLSHTSKYDNRYQDQYAKLAFNCSMCPIRDYFLPHACDITSDDPRAGKWFSSA